MAPHVKSLAKRSANFSFFFFLLWLVSTSLDSTSEQEKLSLAQPHTSPAKSSTLYNTDLMRGSGKDRKVTFFFLTLIDFQQCIANQLTQMNLEIYL